MLNKIILAISLLAILSCSVAFHILSRPVITYPPVDTAVFEAGYQAYQDAKAEQLMDNTIQMIKSDSVRLTDSDRKTLIPRDTVFAVMDFMPESFNKAFFGDAIRIYYKGYTANDVFCLAKNIFFEARNQEELGQISVGVVTLQREKKSGKSICEVVKKKSYVESKRRNVCQFSWVCDASHHVNMNNILEREAWYASVDLSKDLLNGKYKKLAKTQFKGVLNYHTKKVSPKWSKKMIVVATIGDHIFYKSKKPKKG